MTKIERFIRVGYSKKHMEKIETLIENIEIKSVPRSINQSLIKAYQLVRSFSIMPSNTSEQKRLIMKYYKHRLNQKLLSEIDKSQIYRVAERLYRQAHHKIEQLSPQEKSALDTFLEYEEAISLGDNNKAEESKERICIQLENEDNESLLVQEVQRALFPKD